VPCEVTTKSPYSPKEWKQIEKLAAEKGKAFSNEGTAKKYLAGL